VDKLLDYSSDEQPKVFQIFGNDAQCLLKAALIVEGRKPHIIDINMGCSTRRVSRRGSGVAMMKDLHLIEQTFSLLSTHLQVPVTAKMRLGWEDNENFIEVGKVLEDCGAAALTLHPRTKEEKYKGCARWEAIAALKSAVSIPVIGNGDIYKSSQIDNMISSTGCDAVMIGRGAIGNPWIMSRIDRDELPLSDVALCVQRHCNLMQDYYGSIGLTLFRKHLKRYFANMPDLRPMVKQLVQIECPHQFNRLLTEIEESFGSSLVGQLTG
jgi:nifR3 family TIM-barrel protein